MILRSELLDILRNHQKRNDATTRTLPEASWQLLTALFIDPICPRKSKSLLATRNLFLLFPTANNAPRNAVAEERRIEAIEQVKGGETGTSTTALHS